MYDVYFVPSEVMLQDFERFPGLGQNWLGRFCFGARALNLAGPL